MSLPIIAARQTSAPTTSSTTASTPPPPPDKTAVQSSSKKAKMADVNTATGGASGVGGVGGAGARAGDKAGRAGEGAGEGMRDGVGGGVGEGLREGMGVADGTQEAVDCGNTTGGEECGAVRGRSTRRLDELDRSESPEDPPVTTGDDSISDSKRQRVEANESCSPRVALTSLSVGQCNVVGRGGGEYTGTGGAKRAASGSAAERGGKNGSGGVAEIGVENHEDGGGGPRKKGTRLGGEGGRAAGGATGVGRALPKQRKRPRRFVCPRSSQKGPSSQASQASLSVVSQTSVGSSVGGGGGGSEEGSASP